MKTNLFIAAALLVTVSLSAQETTSVANHEPGARIGIKGGLSMATLVKSGDNSFSTNPLYGFNAGVVIVLIPTCILRYTEKQCRP